MNGNPMQTRPVVFMLLAGVVAAALGDRALGVPIEAGQTLTAQRFEWQFLQPNRWGGSYGQYEVAMQAGIRYEVFTCNPHSSDPLHQLTFYTDDPYLYLLDPVTRAILAEDDDSKGARQAKLTFTPAASGHYLVLLRAYEKGKHGYCSLSVRALPPRLPGGAASPLYPDLIVWGDRLRDAEIFAPGDGSTILRFSNAAANVGEGALEVHGVVHPDGTTLAYQRVYYDDISYADREAGTFSFVGHEDHDHFHFDDFADYNLREVTPSNGVGGVVASSQKVSFCLMDSLPYDPCLPAASGDSVYTCHGQGISVGWADLYRKELSGQSIAITLVPDGIYWLESVVDPMDRLVESENSLNDARIKIHIDKSSGAVTVLE